MTDLVRKSRPQTPDQPSLFLSLSLVDIIPGGLKPGIPCATFLVKNGPKSNCPKTIKIEQLGLRRGLRGHSFKSSYSLELILDFWKNTYFCCLCIFF